MKKYLHEFPNGTIRKCTSDEITIAEDISVERARLEEMIADHTKELQNLIKDCEHTVCFDTEGHPYNVRECVACGHTSLL